MTTPSLFDDELVGAPVWPDQARYLLSYAYVNDEQVQLCRDYGVDLVMDSGAFTTAASGKQMDHDGYLAWLRDNADAITFALSLDVIGDYEASHTNHQYALDRVGDVVKMVPTFHLGSPLGELERMCQEYDFLSIGGAVPYARQPRHLAMVLRQCHRIAADHGAQLHGLGMTGNTIIHSMPWYSVDSSAWLSPARFPSLPLADRAGKLQQMEHGWTLDAVERQLVTQYGGDPDLVATPGWSLKDRVGAVESVKNRGWVLTATARAYMYVEARKNADQPNHPIKLYLSGNLGGLDGGAVGVIHRAWQQGTPW